jgi:hypothetical protein
MLLPLAPCVERDNEAAMAMLATRMTPRTLGPRETG